MSNPEKKSPSNAEADRLVTDNYGLLVYQARRFHPENQEQLEELVQVGAIGMMKAIKTFEEDKGKFSTYACRCIFNEIFNFLKKNRKHNQVINQQFDVSADTPDNIEEYLPDNLSYQERTIIEMKLGNHSRKEIAAAIGESENTAKYLIRRTLQKIRMANEI